MDFSKLHLLPVHGKSRGKYYLEVWLAATKAAGTPYYFILDKGAGKEAKKFLSNGTLKYGENFFLLQGELEDYYPVDVLITSLEKEYTLSLSEDEKAKISKGRRSKEIEAILKRKKRVFPSTWKIDVGKQVADNMEPLAIPSEIADILTRIESNVRRHYGQI